MAVLLIICTIIFIICVFKWIFRNKELYNFADQIPGPKAYAVIGSSHKFVKKNEQGEYTLKSESRSEKYIELC